MRERILAESISGYVRYPGRKSEGCRPQQMLLQSFCKYSWVVKSVGENKKIPCSRRRQKTHRAMVMPQDTQPEPIHVSVPRKEAVKMHRVKSSYKQEGV